MNPGTFAYIAATGWIGGRLVVVLLETTGHAAYAIRQASGFKNLGLAGSKRDFSMTRDNRFSTGKDFKQKAGAYLAANQTNIIIPALRVLPNQTLLGLLQEFDSLRQNNAFLLGGGAAPAYALQRIKPLKKPQEAYFADDLSLIAKPLLSYWQLVKYNVLLQSDRVGHSSVMKRIRNNFIGLVLLLEPFMFGYFIYLATALRVREPLGLALGMTVFSLIFYVWIDRQRGVWQKARLILLAPIISWFMYLLSLTRLVALLRTVAIKAREDWANWQPQAA